jgi:hypothetical protein
MISAFHGFSLLVKFAIVGGAVLSIVVSIAVYNESQKMKGEARVIERSRNQGKINEAKARKAHDRAAAPGAPKRVLEQFCRDCN